MLDKFKAMNLLAVFQSLEIHDECRARHLLD
jgi:hypothetical protein